MRQKYLLLPAIILLFTSQSPAQKAIYNNYQVYVVALFLSENNDSIPTDTINYMLDPTWINTVAQFLEDIQKANPTLSLKLPAVEELSLDLTFEDPQLKAEWFRTKPAQEILDFYFLELKASKSDIASKIESIAVVGNHNWMDWLNFSHYLYYEITDIEKFERTTVQLSRNDLWELYDRSNHCVGDDCVNNHLFFDPKTNSIYYGSLTFSKSRRWEKTGWQVRYDVVGRTVEEFYFSPKKEREVM